jgi:hypothetical protein
MSWEKALPYVFFGTWLGWRLGKWYAFPASVWAGLGLGVVFGLLRVVTSSPAEEAPRSEAG